MIGLEGRQYDRLVDIIVDLSLKDKLIEYTLLPKNLENIETYLNIWLDHQGIDWLMGWINKETDERIKSIDYDRKWHEYIVILKSEKAH